MDSVAKILLVLVILSGLVLIANAMWIDDRWLKTALGFIGGTIVGVAGALLYELIKKQS